jgi:hypothetical protein
MMGAGSISVCIVVIDRAMSEYLIGKDMERSCHGFVEILSWNIPGSREESQKTSVKIVCG